MPLRRVTRYFLLENPARSRWLQMKLSPMQMECPQYLGLGFFTLHSKKSWLIIRVRQTLSGFHTLNILMAPPSVLYLYCAGIVQLFILFSFLDLFFSLLFLRGFCRFLFNCLLGVLTFAHDVFSFAHSVYGSSPALYTVSILYHSLEPGAVLITGIRSTG